METLLLEGLGVMALVVLGLAMAYQLCRLLGFIVFELFCRTAPVRPVVVPRMPVLMAGEDLRRMAGGLADLTRVAADERGRRRRRHVLVVGDDLRRMAGGLADLTRVAADERGRRRRRPAR